MESKKTKVLAAATTYATAQVREAAAWGPGNKCANVPAWEKAVLKSKAAWAALELAVAESV